MSLNKTILLRTQYELAALGLKSILKASHQAPDGVRYELRISDKISVSLNSGQSVKEFFNPKGQIVGVYTVIDNSINDCAEPISSNFVCRGIDALSEALKQSLGMIPCTAQEPTDGPAGEVAAELLCRIRTSRVKRLSASSGQTSV